MTDPRPPPRIVATRDAFDRLVDELAREERIAVDTESNSFHVYTEHVCLIQISTHDRDFVVDPFAVDVKPLGGVFAGRETVLHGADYDVRCLRREYGWRLPRLFDTMLAAKALGKAQLGLGALVETHFGVKLSKEFQRSDWGRRPLTPAQLAYASLDTRFLLPLRDTLHAELAEKGLVDRVKDEFAKLAAVEPRPKVFDPEGWRKLKAARSLDAPGKQVLAALWVAREEAARRADRPPFKVLGEQQLVEIAKRRPKTREELGRIPGVTPHVLRRMGDAIVAALASAEPR